MCSALLSLILTTSLHDDSLRLRHSQRPLTCVNLLQHVQWCQQPPPSTIRTLLSLRNLLLRPFSSAFCQRLLVAEIRAKNHNIDKNKLINRPGNYWDFGSRPFWCSNRCELAWRSLAVTSVMFIIPCVFDHISLSDHDYWQSIGGKIDDKIMRWEDLVNSIARIWDTQTSAVGGRKLQIINDEQFKRLNYTSQFLW